MRVQEGKEKVGYVIMVIRRENESSEKEKGKGGVLFGEKVYYCLVII